MTDIRELLRDATGDLDISIDDPVTRVRRATTRRRRSAAAVLLVAAAVIAGIVVPLTVVGSSTTTTSNAPVPPKAGVVERWEPDDGQVATGFGKLWGLACCGRSSGESWVDELDPTTGERIARITVPTPTSSIAVGAGYVWVIGANAGGGGPSAITAIDPATRHVSTVTSHNPHAAPYAIAFAAGSAWVTVPELDEVWRVTTGTGVGVGAPPGFQPVRIHVPGIPWTIAVTGNGQIWVQQLSRNSLSRIRPIGQYSARVTQTVSWSGKLLARAAADTVWATAGRRTFTQLTPANLAGCSACAQSEDTVAPDTVDALVQTKRGLFVSSFGGGLKPGHTYFYSVRDLGRSHAQPTARTDIGGDLTADGRGVVIGYETEGLFHWVPAG